MSIFLKAAGTLIAVLLTFGAMFAAANTMFAAVSSRTREIGTMRALGFSQWDILISFLGESFLLCVLGGVLGLLATLPLNLLDDRDLQLRQLRVGLDQLSLRLVGRGRRHDHDRRHGPLRRHVPRPPRRPSGSDRGAAGIVRRPALSPVFAPVAYAPQLKRKARQG